jgi:hypothetical protein
VIDNIYTRENDKPRSPAPDILQYKTHWNDKETEALLDYLIENKTLGQGNGSFKDQVFQSALETISGLLSNGPVKTVKTCRTKWTSVRISLVIFAYLFTDY